MADLLLPGLTLTLTHLLNQEGSKRRKSGGVPPRSVKRLSLRLLHQQSGLKTLVVVACWRMLKEMLQKKLKQVHSISHEKQERRREGGGPTRVTGRGGKSSKRRQKRERKEKGTSLQVWSQARGDAAQALRGCNRFCHKEDCTFNLCLQNTFRHPLTITINCVLKA